MEILQLRYFLTVAETLNISRAARQHMIPQPAMSKTISKLEKELKVPLFTRYKNRLTLTEEGQRFYQSVRLSLSTLDQAVDETARGRLPLQGEIRILVRQHRRTVIDCIAEFKKRHPNVSFRIFYEQEKQESSEFDLCVSCDSPDESYNRNLCLITEKIMAVLSRDHSLSKKKKIRFSDLRKEEFATVYQNSKLWEKAVLHCQMEGFSPKLTVICGDLYCLMAYVATGLAITLGPEISWSGLNGGEVVFVPMEPAIERSTYLFWNEERTGELSEQFRNFLTEYFKKIDREYQNNFL